MAPRCGANSREKVLQSSLYPAVSVSNHSCARSEFLTASIISIPTGLGPWDSETCVKCFSLLAESYAFSIEDGVAEAVYNALGIGIPHQVQSFFARLREFAIMHDRDRVTVKDINDVYRDLLLGPSGQNDLVHYETRLKDVLDDQSYTIAMVILAEAAVNGMFTPMARRTLDRSYSKLMDDAPERIADALEILVHDGYLECGEEGYRFASRLLKDWWSARYSDHHIPIPKPPS